jgi:hypothetical protein
MACNSVSIDGDIFLGQVPPVHRERAVFFVVTGPCMPEAAWYRDWPKGTGAGLPLRWCRHGTVVRACLQAFTMQGDCAAFDFCQVRRVTPPALNATLAYKAQCSLGAFLNAMALLHAPTESWLLCLLHAFHTMLDICCCIKGAALASAPIVTARGFP